MLMSKAIRVLKYILIISLAVLMVDCAPAKQNPWATKRKNASKVNTTQLGRNKYYFSSDYQKKLNKNYKKKK